MDIIGAFAAYSDGNERSSGSSARLFGTSSGGGNTARVWTPALAGGTYTLKTMSKGANNNQALTLYICDLDGQNTYYTGKSIASRSTSSWNISTLEGLVIPDGKALCFFNNSTSNHNHYIDYFTLERTGDATVSATIGSTGWTTFASAYPLNLSSMTASSGTVTAYYASAIGDGNVTLTSTDKSDVAAGQGIMLKGTAGATITIPVAASGTSISGNKLIGCTAETPLSANADYYVLVNNGGTADFQSLEDNGATIPAGKAYLDATAGGGAKILRVVIDGQASEVVAPEVAKTEEEEILFNMAGIQVDKNFKGFVVNQKGVKRFNR